MQNSAPPQPYLQQQVAGYGAQRLGGRVGHYGGAMVAADLSRGVDLANFGGSDPQQLEKAKPTQISAPPTTLPAAPVVSGHGQLVEGEAAIDQYVALQIVQAQDAYAVSPSPSLLPSFQPRFAMSTFDTDKLPVLFD